MAYPQDIRPITVEILINEIWVDISDYVQQSSPSAVTRGAGGEDNSMPSTTMRLLLHNSDGRFTQDNPMSPYYPYLTQNTQIRYVIEHASVSYTRFYGEISEWPTVVESVAEDSWVEVAAGNIFRRWERGQPVISPLRRAFESSDNLLAYWPLEDEGSNANTLASGIPGQSSMEIKVAPEGVGTESGFIGSFPVLELGTGRIEGVVPPYSPVGTQWVFYLVKGPVLVDDTTILNIDVDGGTIGSFSVLAHTNGDLRFRWYDQEGAILGTSSYAGTHNINNRYCMLRVPLTQGSGVTWHLYLTGQEDGATTSHTTATIASQTMGRIRAVIFGRFLNQNTPVGHVAVFNGTPALEPIIGTALTGFRGETAGDRYLRICEENNISGRMIGDPADTPQMGSQPVETVRAILEECADVTHGVIFESRDEIGVTFLILEALYNQSTDKRVGPDAVVLSNSGLTTQINVDSANAPYLYPGAQFKIYVTATGSTSGVLHTVTEVEDNGVQLFVTYTPASASAPTTANTLSIHRNGYSELDYSAGEIQRPFAPKRDDRLTANRVRVKRPEGSEIVVEESVGPRSTQDPPNGIGLYDIPYELNLYSDGKLAEQATWLLNQGTRYENRFPDNLGIAMHHSSLSARQAELLNMDIGHKLVVTDAEEAHLYDPLQQIMRGYVEIFDGNRLHTITANTISALQYNILEFDNTDLDCRWAGDNTTLAEDIDSTQTGSIDVSTGATIWTQDATDFPLDVMIGGERITLSDINGAPGGVSFVGVGTSDTDTSNNTLTPGMPAGVLAGDIVFIYATVGITSANIGIFGGINHPSNWHVEDVSGLGGVGTFSLMWREYDGVWTMPSVSCSGGSASYNFMAQSCAFRGMNVTAALGIGFRTQLGSVNPEYSDIPISWNADSVAGQSGMILACGWKFTSWTSVAPPTDFVEIGELDTTTADDAGQTWAYKIGAAASGSGTFDITTPVDDLQWHKYMVFFFPLEPQEFVISARSVNGVVKSHTAGTPVDVAEPFNYGL